MWMIAKLFLFGRSSDHHSSQGNYRKLFPHRIGRRSISVANDPKIDIGVRANLAGGTY